MDYDSGLRFGSTRATNKVQSTYVNIEPTTGGTSAAENDAYVQYVTGTVASGDATTLAQATLLEPQLAALRAQNASCCLNTRGGTRLKLRAWHAGPTPTVTVGSATDPTAISYCRFDAPASAGLASFSRFLSDAPVSFVPVVSAFDALCSSSNRCAS